MKNLTSITTRKLSVSTLMGLISLLAIVLVAAVFINDLSTLGVRAESSPMAQTQQTCTPTTTVTEGDLFPGGVDDFIVSSGPGSVTVDPVNAFTGLQSLTVVGVPINAIVKIPPFVPGTFNPVVVTFTVINPALPVDFTLRAANTFHAIFIRVRCGVTVTPTAAMVSVGGRVMTATGRGITGVRLSLTDSQGNVRTTVSTTSGYYRFDDVEVGSTYIITATGKNYSFSQPSNVLNVNDETDEVNFIGNLIKRYRM